MTTYVLAVDVTEDDGVCHHCPKGPHIHVLVRDVIAGALAVEAIMDSPAVKRHFEAEVARAVEAELARREGNV